MSDTYAVRPVRDIDVNRNVLTPAGVLVTVEQVRRIGERHITYWGVDYYGDTHHVTHPLNGTVVMEVEHV